MEYLTTEQKDPEIVLQDVLNDLLDNKKYLAYKEEGDLFQLIKAVKKITDSICKKVAIVNNDNANKRKELQIEKVNKDEWVLKYNKEHE